MYRPLSGGWQDVYGLGLVAYALLTGHLRHDWEDGFSMLMTGISGVQWDRVSKAHHRCDFPQPSSVGH